MANKHDVSYSLYVLMVPACANLSAVPTAQAGATAGRYGKQSNIKFQNRL